MEIVNVFDNDSSDDDSDVIHQIEMDKIEERYSESDENDQITDNKPADLNLPKRVLIVDDEPFNVIGMQLSLSRIGIKGLASMVDRAYNGLEAFNKV